MPTEVLLERDAELSRLADRLEAVRQSGRGHVLLLGGEAGVGKTTVLRRFAEEPSRSARILWGGCDPLFAPRPLGPLLGVAESSGDELATVVEHGALPYDVATALERELGERAPTVLVLEDAHWADEATLDVLRLLARRIERVPALVVVSYRDDELDATHPFRLVLGELATNRTVGRLRLAPLSQEAVAELAEPYGVDALELFRKTAGNPFFVVEALATGTDGIPDTVRDAVLARAARLTPAAKAMLEAVAVVPPRAELWLLEALVGETGERLDECLSSGMLRAEPAGVVFRHELARLAVEESVAPHRKLELHRLALAALLEPPIGRPDLARLAHHADAAADGPAVLEYAPAAATLATSLGAYHEAAAQYERALRFGDDLPPGRRAELLERRSQACYVTDQNDEAIEAIQEAIGCRRRNGDRLAEGDALRWLSQILWCPGRTAEAEQAGRGAVDLLESMPPGRELAMAYANLATTRAAAFRADEAVELATRACELAGRFDDTGTVVTALSVIAMCMQTDDRWVELERCLTIARDAGLDEELGLTVSKLVPIAVESKRFDIARRHLAWAVDFCSDRGLERDRLYLLASSARLELDTGRWPQATDLADTVLSIHRTSINPRIVALVVLALVRARRGDPGSRRLLDEAWALAEPTRELPRMAPVATARAEAAWLEGNPQAVDEATEATLRLAVERGWSSLAAELETWRRRADLPSAATGDREHAAALWDELGCPYEAALALADEDREDPLRRALDVLQRLGARPAAAIVSRRLRELGARGLPRGPRPATRRNPAGLTTRELEVLALLTNGLRNAEIAAQLVLSERTVDHHVGAILRKLKVRTRTQASSEAVRLGLAG
jgi:DNA-binding CsgD family transcriptional regulator/tetratricopeptide (TPR) repeat protein